MTIKQKAPLPLEGKEAPEVLMQSKDSEKKRDLQGLRQVGDKIERTIITYDVEGRPVEETVTITKETVMDRFGKSVLTNMPFYAAHCIVPDHITYKQVIGECWNIYYKLPAVPIKGTHDAWDIQLQRVFGEQIELGLDYLTIAYRYPTQTLPVLCLVSEENQTGKSSFGNGLSHLFGNNVGFFGQDDLSSTFNVWIKHLFAVFEEISETKNTLNKIKNLSTAKTATLNQKYKSQVTFQPFVKLIILSNNEKTFVKANQHDIRYWVRRLVPIPTNEFISDFDERLRAEVPALLYTLHHRTISTPKQSRMWFHADLITTEALNSVRKESRSDVVKDLELTINELLDEIPFFHATATDMAELLKNKYPVSKIKSALQEMNFVPEDKVIRFASVPGTKREGKSRTGTPYFFQKKNYEPDTSMGENPY